MVSLTPHLAVDARALESICRASRIRSIRVFGSALRPDFGPDSDVDLLVEFEPGVDPDLFELGGLQQDLSDLFGRDVDLKTPEMFSPSSLARVHAASTLAYGA